MTHIDTKFKNLYVFEHSGFKYQILKAVDDEIYQVIKRNFSKPLKTSASLVSSEIMSKEKYEQWKLRNI